MLKGCRGEFLNDLLVAVHKIAYRNGDDHFKGDVEARNAALTCVSEVAEEIKRRADTCYAKRTNK